MLKGHTLVFVIVGITVVIAISVWLLYGSAQVTTLITLIGLILAIIRYMRPSYASPDRNSSHFRVRENPSIDLDDDDDII